VAPADGETIPANAPALVYYPSHGHEQICGSAGVSTLRLLDAEGEELPFEIAKKTEDGSARLIRPEVPLVPGAEYTFEYLNCCRPYETDEETRLPVPNQTSSFTVVEPTELPDRLGRLFVEHLHTGPIRVWTGTGACTTEIRAAVATLRFELDPRAIPFLPVTRLGAVVNRSGGWTAVRFGDLRSDGRVPRSGGRTGTYLGRRLDRVFAGCGAREELVDNGVPLGKARIVADSFIAGVEQPLPDEVVEVDFRCDEPEHAGDSGAPPAAADGGSKLGPTTAEVQDTQEISEPGKTDDHLQKVVTAEGGGCSPTSPRTGPFPTTWLLLCAICLCNPLTKRRRGDPPGFVPGSCRRVPRGRGASRAGP